MLVIATNRRHVVKIVILGCGRVGAALATMMDREGHTVSIIDYSSEAFRRLEPDFRGTTIIGNGVDEEVLIGGGGDVGYYLTKSLLSKGHEVLLLEKGASRYQSLSDELGQSVVRGDACEARTMEEVGAHRADVVIAVTGEDDDNLVICQMAKKRFKVARTIARLNNPKYDLLFQKLGIDITVSPTRSILSLIEAELPGSSFVTLMTLRRAGLGIIEVRVLPDSPIVGKTLNALT